MALIDLQNFFTLTSSWTPQIFFSAAQKKIIKTKYDTIDLIKYSSNCKWNASFYILSLCIDKGVSHMPTLSTTKERSVKTKAILLQSCAELILKL